MGLFLLFSSSFYIGICMFPIHSYEELWTTHKIIPGTCDYISSVKPVSRIETGFLKAIYGTIFFTTGIFCSTKMMPNEIRKMRIHDTGMPNAGWIIVSFIPKNLFK